MSIKIPYTDESAFDGWDEEQVKVVFRLRQAGKGFDEISAHFPCQTPERTEQIYQLFAQWLNRKIQLIRSSSTQDGPTQVDKADLLIEGIPDLFAPVVPWTVNELQVITNWAWRWMSDCGRPWQTIHEKFWESILDSLPGREQDECCTELRKIILRVPMQPEWKHRFVVDRMFALFFKDAESSRSPQSQPPPPSQIEQEGPAQISQESTSQMEREGPSQMRQEGTPQIKNNGSQLRRSQRLSREGS